MIGIKVGVDGGGRGCLPLYIVDASSLFATESNRSYALDNSVMAGVPLPNNAFSINSC